MKVESAVAVEHVSKRFGHVFAVSDISFTLGSGQIVALLGGNGAGKTTTISMLLGLLLPTSGKVRVLGVDMLRHRYQVLPRINFSSPYVDLPHRLTVEENLRVYAKLYGVRSTPKRIKLLADDLEFDHLLKKQYGNLSAGQRTRVGMAKALLNEPTLLLMDEPTASLDPDSADRIRHYLQKYQSASGATVILASHNMKEVEQLCQHVIMMKNGRIVDSGSPEQLLEKHGKTNMEQVFLAIARAQGESV